MNIATIKQTANGTWLVVLENGKTFSGINKQDVIDFANEWAEKHQTKQCGGLIAHFVGDSITCVRDTKTGKFATKAAWKKATEKQALAKAYAIVALQPINMGYNKGSRGNSVLSFAIIGALLAVLVILLMPVISERQAQYERVTSEAVVNSVTCNKASCNNYDYTKGVN